MDEKERASLLEAATEAAYDATRLEDGTPQFADAGFCVGHAHKIATAILAAIQAAGYPLDLTPFERRVLAERRRQVTVEGWTPEHYDEHSKGEMALAAASYAIQSTAPLPGIKRAAYQDDALLAWPCGCL